MKRLLQTTGLLVALSPALHAEINLSETFSSYTNGDLAGQGSWTQTGGTTNAPVQVNNGVAVLGATGQDIYKPLTSGLTLADGGSFYIGATINVATAAAGGDYFLHFTPALGDSSLFYARTFIRSSGAGFQLGYLETSGAGGSVNYGATEFSFGTDYRIVLAYNRVAGLVNDTANLYVNPADAQNQGNNTALLSDTWTSVSAEPAGIAAVNLRQGSAANAPTLTVDDLIVATTFAEAVAVPEPTAASLLALAGGAWLLRRSRRA
jgi:hypothetical protein